jgi:hypothetical protein
MVKPNSKEDLWERQIGGGRTRRDGAVLKRQLNISAVHSKLPEAMQIDSM